MRVASDPAGAEPEPDASLDLELAAARAELRVLREHNSDLRRLAVCCPCRGHVKYGEYTADTGAMTIDAANSDLLTRAAEELASPLASPLASSPALHWCTPSGP